MKNEKRVSILIILFGTAILFLGLLALYYFTVVSHQSGESALARQIVLGLGITSFGVFNILLGLNKLKAPFLIMVSLVSFWFAIYSVTFDIKSFMTNGEIEFYSLFYSGALILISAVFAYLSIKKWKMI